MSAPKHATPSSSACNRFLVVDDDPLLRTTVKILLNIAGYEAVEAANGVEAVSAVENADKPFTGILLDLNMPIMDGHKALVEIRKRDKTVPIIVVSSLADRLSSQERLVVSGAIQKPFAAEDFLSEVNDAMTTGMAAC